MLRIPRHSTIAFESRRLFGQESSGSIGEPARDLLSFRNTVIRGIFSAALIFLLVVLFLL
jgi:hypothetical protein